jgi:hypothetical protein
MLGQSVVTSGTLTWRDFGYNALMRSYSGWLLAKVACVVTAVAALAGAQTPRLAPGMPLPPMPLPPGKWSPPLTTHQPVARKPEPESATELEDRAWGQELLPKPFESNVVPRRPLPVWWSSDFLRRILPAPDHPEFAFCVSALTLPCCIPARRRVNQLNHAFENKPSP